MLRGRYTRFRAYQLGEKGSSFSYYADGHFTLIEARLTSFSRPSLESEISACGKEQIDTLHITSWDTDHCKPRELEEILDLYAPQKVEIPGYVPQSEAGKRSQSLLLEYRKRRAEEKKNSSFEVIAINPEYIDSLEAAERLAFSNMFANPRHIDKSIANNNSTIKFFRRGSFKVLSLGDVESSAISARIQRSKLICDEVDIIILAHHGADNGFTTNSFIKHLKPQVAICSSDFDNQYDHPAPAIRTMLQKRSVDLYTTKTGDVSIFSTGEHVGDFQIVNLKANSTEIKAIRKYKAKTRSVFKVDDYKLRDMYERKGGFRKG